MSEIAFFGKPKVIDKHVYVYALENFFTKKDSPVQFLFTLKEYFLENYRKNSLNADTFSIGKAIIFGERDEISYETRKKFIETGLIHLLAISGLHVGLLVAFFLFFIRSSKLQTKVILSILPLYSIFTGFHIPVVRASFMASLYFLGKSKSLKINPLNILFFVAFVIILVSPETLFSVGFQLSFIATLGILLGLDLINVNIFEVRAFNILLQSVLLSFIATIFTLPIVLYYFGAFSPISIFATSVVLLPMYAFVGFSVFNILTGFLVAPLVKVMDYFGFFFLKLVEFFHVESGYFKGFSPDKMFVFLFLLSLIFVFLIRVNVFIKVSLIFMFVSIFLFFSKDDFSGYRIYSFKGKHRPYFLISKQNEFIVIVSDFLSNRIYNIINRTNPRYVYVLTKRPSNFVKLNYFPVIENSCFRELCIYKTKNGYKVKILDRIFFIKNETKVYEFEKK
ncbi:MAG: ComEC/Rec2 family competence protein [Aquificae bacterium]|nr:ComEC/Rec2 family competence protein [Aquificota bacterium]